MARKRNKARRRTQNSRHKAPSTQIQNAYARAPSGISGRQDLARGAQTAEVTSNPVLRTQNEWSRAREWTRLWYTSWEARKVVNIPVEDMLRTGFDFDGLEEDQQAILETKMRKINFSRILKQALRQERLVGGAVMLIGLRDQTHDTAEPLNIESVRPGDLQFVNMVPRTRITRTDYGEDPLSANFGHPEFYQIWGYRVHRSRLMIFDGDPLTTNGYSDHTFISITRDGFGSSILAPIYDDLIRAIETRQAAMQLIKRASVLLINNADIKLQQATRPGQSTIDSLTELADHMSMFNAAMIDGRNVTLDQWSATFGSVPDLLEKFVVLIAAGADIPATRFLGQAPGGLNATGRSDLENYYNMIDARRENILRPVLEEFKDILIRSELPNVNPEDVKITFPPLWNESEKEIAETREKNALSITALFDRGIIGQAQALNEAQATNTLAEPDFIAPEDPFDSIEMDEIGIGDDTPPPPGLNGNGRVPPETDKMQ